MRNQRAILVAGTASMLFAVSAAIMVLRPFAEAAPNARMKITLLRDGAPVHSVFVERELPADLEAIFPVHDARPHAYLVEPVTVPIPSNTSWFSPSSLPAASRSVVEFLLLLPAATLVVCLFRNVVGLNSFGTFAPALLGLAFRDVRSPIGVAVLFTVLMSGWSLRRGLNHLHLLQVPRTALMLSFVVLLLLLFIFAGNSLGRSGSYAPALFPLVILTGMIERCWSMDEEDGALASFRTLMATTLIAGCVWLMASIPAVPNWLMRHPETLGAIMAAQLLLGRYTGFRLLEVSRFRLLVAGPPFPIAVSARRRGAP
jgi:hypothetical protein